MYNLINEKSNLKSLLFIVAGIFLIVCFSSCDNNKLIIANQGDSNYKIVVSKLASEKNVQSANVLAEYLKKIGNVKLAVVEEGETPIEGHNIFVRLDSNLKEHEIQLKSENNDIYILAGSEESLRNAVYEFLEIYLGCKWYSPEVADIPKMETVSITLPISYNYEPDITTRTVHSRLFYKNPAFAEIHKVTNVAFPYYVPSARVHTFHKFIPEEEFFIDHPEYFALRGNKRTPTQLCLTNEKVLEIVTDSVSSLFKQYPKAEVISVSQDDNQQYCECDNCSLIDEKEGANSGTMIYFVNSIADKFPDKTISTLAYQHTRKPPLVKPRSNVLITLCSIECDRSGPIEEKCTDFADDLIGWGKLTDNIRIWDYTTQFTNFLAPFPNLRTIQPNIRFFRDQNTKWIFEQHSHNPSELFELRSYMMAKLLWNPDFDVDQLITEFTDGYYHEAGIHVRNYIELIHNEINNDKDFFLFLYGDPSQAFSSYLNPDLLEQYNTIFDDAEKAVINKPDVLNRVRIARLSTDYAILEAARKGLTERLNLVVKNDDGAKIGNPFIQEKLENFMASINMAEITLMNEMGFKATDYYNSYIKAIDVASLSNIAKDKKVTLLTNPKKYANEDPQTLTDGALGGNGFYANWLGFEGNDLIAVVDLDAIESFSTISMAFLKVTNHVVFYPNNVTYYYSNDNKNFTKLGSVENKDPLTKKSKVNEIQYFDLEFQAVKGRYIKVVAESMKVAPYWHHASGLGSWIFADEIIIN